MPSHIFFIFISYSFHIYFICWGPWAQRAGPGPRGRRAALWAHGPQNMKQKWQIYEINMKNIWLGICHIIFIYLFIFVFQILAKSIKTSTSITNARYKVHISYMFDKQCIQGSPCLDMIWALTLTEWSAYLLLDSNSWEPMLSLDCTAC